MPDPITLTPIHGGAGIAGCSQDVTGRDKLMPMIDLQEFAELAGVSIRTVFRWIRAGRVRAIHPSLRTTRITYEEAQRFLSGHAGDISMRLDGTKPAGRQCGV